MKYTIIDGELYRTDELYHHGVKGMRWGVRRKPKKSNADLKKDIARKKLENEHAQQLAANKQAARQRRAQAKQAKAQIRAQDKKARIQARLESVKNRTAFLEARKKLIDAKKQQLESKKLLRAANVKLSRKDQKLVDQLNKEKQLADAKTDKLKSDIALREARKENWSPVRKLVNKILSKLGNATLDGVAEAGKNLIRDKLTAFGKVKLGLIDPDEALVKETKRSTNKLLLAQNKKKLSAIEDENAEKEREKAALDKKLEKMSKRSPDDIPENSIFENKKSGYDNFNAPSEKVIKSREKQEEYRRLREDIMRKKAEEQSAAEKRAEERDAYKKEIKRRNKNK